jgi:predicted RNA binding protein YcfA (HicA-like mRNA interferase family)
MKEVGKVSWRRFESFLLAEGCLFKGKEGSHCKYKKPGLSRPIIVPARKELPDFIILNNLRTLGLTREYFIEKMKDIK